MNEKLNCWEYMKCGREPDGINSEKFDTCPASTIEMYTGVNDGINAGRFCWKIAGTMYFDSIKGSAALEIIIIRLPNRRIIAMFFNLFLVDLLLSGARVYFFA